MDITEFFQPGIIRVLCIPENRAAFFAFEDEVWSGMYDFMDHLKNGYCYNKQLLHEYKKYGENAFECEIVAYGPEYQDIDWLMETADQLVESWQGNLYKNGPD